MPRTKLDRYGISVMEARARILRTAAARLGHTKDKDIGNILGLSAAGISAKLRGDRSWSVSDLQTLASRLRLNDEEIVRFVKGGQ